MMTEVNNYCAACHGTKLVPIEQFTAGDFSTWYAACEDCGLVTMFPRPTATELSAYYEREYWNIRAGDVERKMQKQLRRAGYIASFLERAFKAKSIGDRSLADCRRILEVGSSFGMTLIHLGKEIAAHGGAPTLFGVEPSEHAVTTSVEAYHSIRFIGKSWEDLPQASETGFDLVVLSHVLEHLTDPVQCLRVLKSVLSTNGVLFVEVPNFYGHPSLEYAHNFCFTENTLRQVIHQAGLEVLSFSVNGHDESFPFYLTCLLAPTESTAADIAPEKVASILEQRAAAKVAFNELRSIKPRPE
jgi:2-polyprenyl-3-methyl-5-hydroxy-6-metoxy-1,4-benzoquinol methylase